MIMKTIRSMNCVNLDMFTLTLFTWPKKHYFLDIHAEEGVSDGRLGRVLNQALALTHIVDRENQQNRTNQAV